MQGLRWSKFRGVQTRKKVDARKKVSRDAQGTEVQVEDVLDHQGAEDNQVEEDNQRANPQDHHAEDNQVLAG